ncbi:MAG: exodeoxyribonuclease V subunit alpha [Lysobacterales bacterium]
MSLLAEAPPERTDLGAAVQAWVLRKTGSKRLARALALAARAEMEGHACVRLGPAGEHWPAGDLSELAAHPWISDGSRISAGVLTDQGDCFLWRNWQHEACVAEALHARRLASTEPPFGSLVADLDLLFAGMDPDHCDLQRRAVERVVGKHLFVLSGGPGTGKTTTVLRMLLMLLRQAQNEGRGTPALALAAPTGKAAQRLSQAIRDGKAGLRRFLDGQATSDDWSPLLGAIPDAAQTLHRLLGANPARDAFTHDQAQPLPYSVVVVDEASMVDLATMRALLDALAPTATLILVGDPDQLVSVSAGSVLADIVHVTERDDGFRRCSMRLRHVWRAEHDLAAVYEAARHGDAAALRRRLQRVDGAALHEVASIDELNARLDHWSDDQSWASVQMLTRQRQESDPAAAFAALAERQLLTALRGGPFGSERINELMDQRLRAVAGGARWYPGRPVLIRHNDYGRRLFNGDIGLACGQGDELRVCFASVDADGRPRWRWLSPRELPDHDLAYALTIHQSQGSEYGHVAVLLPPEASHRILSRQLLYTAISRARFSVELWSTEPSVDAALAQRSERHGGLRTRLLDGTRRTDNAP